VHHIFFFHFQTTLRELMQPHWQSPYAKSVKVKVICNGDALHYRNDKQEDRQLLNAVIADHTQAVKCTIYDVQKFNRFVKGKTIIIRNCIKEDRTYCSNNQHKSVPFREHWCSSGNWEGGTFHTVLSTC
jgi:uncharacterized protein YqjF (DUF2071 family)